MYIQNGQTHDHSTRGKQANQYTTDVFFKIDKTFLTVM
jgi:hypothetical protein